MGVLKAPPFFKGRWPRLRGQRDVTGPSSKKQSSKNQVCSLT